MKVDSTDGEVSEWNEAVFKMKRLHDIQTEINNSKMDPLSKNDCLVNLWNFQVWINSVLALYSEGQAKYSDDEIKEVNQIKDLIENYIKKYPIYNMVIKQNYSCKKETKPYFSQDNWENIRKLIVVLESKVKLYNDKHGLSTKNQENMGGKSILK